MGKANGGTNSVQDRRQVSIMATGGATDRRRDRRQRRNGVRVRPVRRVKTLTPLPFTRLWRHRVDGRQVGRDDPLETHQPLVAASGFDVVSRQLGLDVRISGSEDIERLLARPDFNLWRAQGAAIDRHQLVRYALEHPGPSLDP
jgi:hypothetical protein